MCYQRTFSLRYLWAGIKFRRILSEKGQGDSQGGVLGGVLSLGNKIGFLVGDPGRPLGDSILRGTQKGV